MHCQIRTSFVSLVPPLNAQGRALLPLLTDRGLEGVGY